MYKIDVDFQIDTLTPPIRRGIKMFCWLKALLSPIQQNNDSFIEYVNLVKRNTKITSQVIVLQQVLNEILSIESGVFIENIQISNEFLVGETENYSSSVFSDETFSEFGIYEDDSSIKSNFKIKIPATAWSTLNTKQKQEFKSYVDSIKLYGTSYIIETY